MDFIWCFLQIEIKMKKPEAVRWEKLEGQGDMPTPKQFIAGLFAGIMSFKFILCCAVEIR
jgi:hypothetical protein